MHPTQLPRIAQLLVPRLAHLAPPTHAVYPPMRDPIPDLPFRPVHVRPEPDDPSDPLVPADVHFRFQVRDGLSDQVQVCRADPRGFDPEEDVGAGWGGEGEGLDLDGLGAGGDGDFAGGGEGGRWWWFRGGGHVG